MKRLALITLLAAGSVVWAATPQSPGDTGSLKIKVGIVLNSGDVKYIAKQKFYLLSASNKQTRKANASIPTFIEFLKLNQASDTFISIVSANPNIAAKLEHGILALPSGQDLRILQPLANTPELFALMAMANKAESCGSRLKCINETQRAQTNISSLLPPFLRWGGKSTYDFFTISASYEAMDRAKKASLLNVKAECLTGFDGTCTFENVPAGKYFISSILPVKVYQNALDWDVPVTIKPDTMESLELSNDNE